MSKTVPLHRVCPTLLLLICGLALSSCSRSGLDVRPTVSPRLSPAPSNLMRCATYESRTQAVLFKSGEKPTTTSEDCKP